MKNMESNLRAVEVNVNLYEKSLAACNGQCKIVSDIVCEPFPW